MNLSNNLSLQHIFKHLNVLNQCKHCKFDEFDKFDEFSETV